MTKIELADNVDPIGLPNTVLDVTGALTDADFVDVFFHTQTISASYKRKWVYEEQEFDSSAGTPELKGTYVAVDVTVTTNREIRRVAMNTFQQTRHQCVLLTDGTAAGGAGWGKAGSIYTSQAGMISRPFRNGDKESSCTMDYTVKSDITTGDYLADNDTSESFSGQFMNDVIANTVRLCPEFMTSLVQI